MKTKEDNKEWHLIHTDNGEWISDEYVEEFSPKEAALLKEKYGDRISFQHGLEGEYWCYKHELQALQQKSDNKQ